jgi:hypothetical protein
VRSFFSRFALVVSCLLLAGSAASAACSHSVSTPWMSAQAYELTLRASSVGEVCGHTAVVLNVESKDGHVIWSVSLLAEYVSVFASDGPVTEADVKRALAAWIDIGQRSALTTTARLPDWPDGADGPKREGDGEFGFYVGEAISRDIYLGERKADRPLFCFVQGMESEGCIIFSTVNGVLDIGGTRFPG